jgi:NCS2 family nucleobase:cation symporter-2
MRTVPRRPEDLIYAVDEVPPWPRLLALGLQHALLISVFLVLLLIVFRHAGATPATTMSALGMGMAALAAGVALQALRLGPVGSGYLAAPVFSAIYLGPSLLAVGSGGLPAVFGMTLFAALVEVALAPLLSRLRQLFPPLLSGIIVLIVGIQLGLIGIIHLLAVEFRHTPSFAAHLGVGWLTLAVMVGLSIWGRGLVRLLCPVIGMAVGLGASLATGIVAQEAWQNVLAAPAFALPHPDYLAYSFVPDLVPAFLIAAIAAMLRTVGAIATCQKINDADWKRPDLTSIRGGVVADGLGAAVGGLLGVMGMSTAPSLIGVSHASGATSRAIGFACAAILLVLALLPKFAALFLLLPPSVTGAAVTFTASYVIAGGLEIIMARSLDARGTFIVALAVLMALAREQLHGYFAAAPALLRSMAGSMLSLGVVTALIVNALLRLGTTQRATVTFEGGATSLDELERVLRQRSAAWRLAPELADRAVGSTRALIAQVEAAALVRGGAEVTVACDDLELTATVSYSGMPLRLAHTGVHHGILFGERAFSYSLADLLAGIHPDRMSGHVRGDRVAIVLSFDR